MINPTKAISQMTSRFVGISFLGLHSDILLQYGVSVSESSPEIRNAFIRKVYSILREQ